MPTAMVSETTNGYVNAINNPTITNYGWVVEAPGGDYWLHDVGQEFWCTDNQYLLPFRLTEWLDDIGKWKVTWILDWERANPNIVSETNTDPFTQFDFATTNVHDPGEVFIQYVNENMPDSEPEEEELSAEFLDYTFDRPFMFNNRWDVVMRQDGFRNYHPGQVWYCEYEGCEFELGAQLRPDLFGSHNAYRIEWIEAEPDYEEYDPEYFDDNYSEEIVSIDDHDVAPQIATNIGRTVPFVSFEQEFSGNGELVARRLYQDGFGAGQYVNGYHSADGRYERSNGSERFCYVETDSSCGYELIFDRMQLNQRNQAEKISAVQSILKDLKSEGQIRLSARCGFHVHVDVSNWGMKEIVSAYHLWNYLEDPIFRFASAFWNMHRDEEVGGGYSTPLPKGHTGRREIGRTLSVRRDSLNFSPILNARGNCSCQAALYEDWANCTCNVSQPTLEFRVFNATINQRKIRAYLAFCVAFVNIAKSRDFEPMSFPEMRWNGTSIKRDVGNKTWEDASLERIKFILEEFPLTNAEKTDIQYCLRNSSLQPVIELL